MPVPADVRAYTIWVTFPAPGSEAIEFTSGITPDAPRSDNPALLADLAVGLRRIGYTVDGVAALLGESASAALGRDQLVPALLATERPTAGEAPLAAVVRLWLLAVRQQRKDLDAALPEIGVDGLLELGLVREAGSGDGEEPDDGIEALVDLRPYGWAGNDTTGNETTGNGATGNGTQGPDRGAELWVVSDLGAHQRPGVLRRDHVLGIGQASTTLVQATVRRQVDRALDLGTGCGIQAFHLLRHARHVTATDISTRALAFTRFNLMLNSVELDLDAERLGDRISLRLGSMLEPVAGERFDLVVSNPPFVITPRRADEASHDQFTYRDGGLPGDDIVADLIRSLPDVLAPGGTAQMLGNWEVTSGSDWHNRPRTWVDDAAVLADSSPHDSPPDGFGEAAPGSLDAWFIQREQVSPGEYAETWLRDASEGRERDLYVRAYADYLADFASRDVEGIGFGMVWLRRRARALDQAGPQDLLPFRRFEEITYPIEQPIGPYLGTAVERVDWLASHHLPDARLLVADDVTEERHQRPGAEHPGVILLRQGAGLRRTNLMSTELAGFVSACDGDLTVQQLIGALAALLGSGDDFDAASFRSQLLVEVRNLVVDGFLVPV
ncbi:methyltransferase [Arthrobacter sp. M4]|uniref:DUF7059 domain-containing protein n=1 Tax=Arthrobacter sp. M4 TaxID=218160 RepID=UPI0035ABFCB3